MQEIQLLTRLIILIQNIYHIEIYEIIYHNIIHHFEKNLNLKNYFLIHNQIKLESHLFRF